MIARLPPAFSSIPFLIQPGRQYSWVVITEESPSSLPYPLECDPSLLYRLHFARHTFRNVYITYVDQYSIRIKF